MKVSSLPLLFSFSGQFCFPRLQRTMRQALPGAEVGAFFTSPVPGPAVAISAKVPQRPRSGLYVRPVSEVSVPSHHVRSTTGAFASSLEETVSGLECGTGDLDPSLPFYSQHISTLGQIDKSCFLLPLKNTVPSSTGDREGSENHPVKISSLQPNLSHGSP